MISEYLTIEESRTGEIVEKKSRFICTLFHVETEEEAIALIEKTKKQYWDARHNCYAFIVGKNMELKRFSDDGEPSGTAGKPILEVLEGRGLTYTLAIVTRYFGGVLLGTGGLVRAYSDASKTAIEAGEIACMKLMQPYEFVIDYQMVGKIKYSLNEMGIDIAGEEYTDVVTMKIVVPIDICEKVEKNITEITNGKIILDRSLHGVVYLKSKKCN